MNIFFLVVNGDNDGKQKVVHILQSQAQNCAWLRGQESNHGLGDYAPVLITERVGLCLHPAKREPACSLYGVHDVNRDFPRRYPPIRRGSPL